MKKIIDLLQSLQHSTNKLPLAQQNVAKQQLCEMQKKHRPVLSQLNACADLKKAL